MFSFLTGKLSIDPIMGEYIKEQTNNSLKKYKTNSEPTSNIPMYYYVPFVSLFSFLAGYHFSHIIKTLKT
jgi:hypothetical protein